MRVLLLNYEYPPLGGGAGVATAELARRLSNSGATVHVVTSADHTSGELVPSEPVGVGTPHSGLTIYRVRSGRRGIHQAGYRGAAGYVVSALPVVRRLVRAWHYDVAHIFFSLPTGALLPVAVPRDLPVVLSLRGSDVPGYDPTKRSLRVAHFVSTPLTRSIWRRAERVVAVCEALARLARRTLPDVRITVIPNGVDLDRFHPRAGSGPPDSRRMRCIAVARLIGRKGIAELLRAWKRLERGRFALDVVGDGPQAASLRTLAAELDLLDDVSFLGALPQAELAERYRRADVFTLVPRSEAFGNVFAEAMASGLPIIGTNVGGIPELVLHGENGFLVPPGNPAALAEAIKRLAQDGDLRRTMALRNRADAERRLSWQRMTDSYLELYEELGRSRVSSGRP